MSTEPTQPQPPNPLSESSATPVQLPIAPEQADLSISSPKQNYLKYAVFGLVAVIFLLVSYLALAKFYLNTWPFNEEVVVAPTPVVQTQLQPAPLDETANWKTYTSNKLNISFKYPQNWKIQDESYLVIRLIPEENPEVITATPNPNGGFVGRPEVYPKGYARISMGEEFQSLMIGRDQATKREMVIGGRKATLLEYPRSNYLDNIITVIYKQDEKEEWGELNLETTDLDRYRPIFEQILSTFKFTQ